MREKKRERVERERESGGKTENERGEGLVFIFYLGIWESGVTFSRELFGNQESTVFVLDYFLFLNHIGETETKNFLNQICQKIKLKKFFSFYFSYLSKKIFVGFGFFLFKSFKLIWGIEKREKPNIFIFDILFRVLKKKNPTSIVQ